MVVNESTNQPCWFDLQEVTCCVLPSMNPIKAKSLKHDWQAPLRPRPTIILQF